MARELTTLGVTPGATLLVHASLRGTGLDAVPLREALLTALGEDGTLVVPAFTEENSDTSAAHLARVRGMTRRGAAAFRAAMPAFDAASTPCPGMGRLAESVRTARGAVRSAHPQSSFAALGRRAAELLARHPLDSHLGPGSPLGALADAGARVLMINVGFAACTAFHLAEYRPDAPTRSYRCVVKAPDGKSRWVEYEDVVLDDSDFEKIGSSFGWGVAQTGQLGETVTRLFPVKDAVAHAECWMTENRR
ncbi:aminoglycoside N(3)-acetyltransferase [Streptomyces corynorhini]|uniref:Aminoglycoside N(3)-acetyltransferase n=1 Tax=Streptomyces corynorhini TaxID=2282652 RepID=A0A370AZC7_9ACTN|nr:AAC(3) family N-acetyltransferase [Streptomyces corynorhini]RDG34940.1 aminoglycoside N(3)-acetyltransferase [Streptomyces corynorhini]